MSDTSENFAALFEQSFNEDLFTAGKVIDATVIKIEKDIVYLDAGTKSEAYVDISQFKDLKGDLVIKEGEVIRMFLEMPVDGLGETRLSRDKAECLESWKKLKIAYENKETLEGIVKNAVRSGLSLEIDKVRAFLPRSLVDTRGLNDLNDLVGQVVQVKIISFEEQKNNLIVSRRAALEEVSRAERETLLSKIETGDTVKGVVKNLTDYGAFIDLGGIDGLLHITDMAWKRVNHPSEVVEIGQEIEVQVMSLDKEKSRLSLGLKQLMEDPWLDVKEKFQIGSIVRDCKVSNVTDYGAFVSIKSFMDGLVHTSELDWKNRNIHPKKVLKLGQLVDVKIIEIDAERRRISLSIKQCLTNPWVEFVNNNKRGDIVKGPIRSKTEFGLFVGLESGVDGLVHVTDLSWDNNPESLLVNYKKGEQIETVILSMDTERERISLGIKQLSSDSFNEYVTANPKGSIVECEVVELDDKGGAKVKLIDDVEAVLKKSEMIDPVAVGEKVRVVISSIAKKNRRIFISVKMRDVAEEKSAVSEYRKVSKSQEESNTLRDILGNRLEDLNEKKLDEE